MSDSKGASAPPTPPAAPVLDPLQAVREMGQQLSAEIALLVADGYVVDTSNLANIIISATSRVAKGDSNAG